VLELVLHLVSLQQVFGSSAEWQPFGMANLNQYASNPDNGAYDDCGCMHQCL